MKVFISWSGDRSQHIAEILSNWIEQVLQLAEPWISTDIQKGKRWSDEIANKLSNSEVAIIVLTNDNLNSKWVHFEAGAIAQNSDAYVCTLLYDLKPANVEQPLSQFQHTEFAKKDMLKLVKAINTAIGNSGSKSLKEKNLESVFETFWPNLKEELSDLPEPKSKAPVRTDREIMEESLQILRSFKNDSKTTNESDIDLDSIIDYWLEKYANKHGIEHNSVALEDHIEDISKDLSERPEIRMIFESRNSLSNKIEERINDLLPF